MTTPHKDGLVGILAPDGQSYLNKENKSLLDKMGLFGFKNKRGEIAEGVDNHFNPERRDFFSKAIKTTVVGIAAMAGANGIIKTASGKDAYAKEADWIRKLPPGIQIAALPQQRAWSDIQDGAPDWATDYIFPAEYLKYFKTEPAVYLCVAFTEDNSPDWSGSTATIKNLGNLSKMDPMAQWAKGIGYYVARWALHRKYEMNGSAPIYYTPENLKKLVEIPFLNAIFYSANSSTGKERVEQYLSGKVDRRALLNNTMKDLKKADHIDQLVAAWASTWLDNHYNFNPSSTEKELDLVYNCIERPIRHELNINIRGPAYYYKFEGKSKT